MNARQKIFPQEAAVPSVIGCLPTKATRFSLPTIQSIAGVGEEINHLALFINAFMEICKVELFALVS